MKQIRMKWTSNILDKNRQRAAKTNEVKWPIYNISKDWWIFFMFLPKGINSSVHKLKIKAKKVMKVIKLLYKFILKATSKIAAVSEVQFSLGYLLKPLNRSGMCLHICSTNLFYFQALGNLWHRLINVARLSS